MAPKIFITGITGYIAGDAFYALYQKHPEYEYSALVRTQAKADAVKKAYPSVETVLGGLDDFETLKKAAAEADVVLHAADASDHEGAARAIAAGILEGHSKGRPGFWLHTGGTGILTWEDTKYDRLGEPSEKVYNDWDGIEELTNLPDEAFHRNVDKIVLEAGSKHSDVIKSVIVAPPTIYGNGRGPISGRGRQVYELAKLVLTKQYTPVIGQGQARWNNVHVHDLSDLYVLLTEAAVNGNTNAELWGEKGYLIVESGEHVWGDLAKSVGQAAVDLGYLKSADVRALGKDQALDQAGFEAVSWGLNSRARAERANKVLGWKASRNSLEEEVKTIVKSEQERL
ncbi:NAD(P)-binding protein [Hortaea werneckii]|nr:NAD(P)-binding protein [Hortaea werneckii]KAI7318881.1 NAD(P)-binding protein [Hortaea werneckii]